jgi:hypothetical protein
MFMGKKLILLLNNNLKLNMSEQEKLLNNCIRYGGHFDFAKLMYFKFKNEFIRTKNNWEMYDGKNWNINHNGYSLRIKISEDLKDLFLNEEMKTNETLEVLYEGLGDEDYINILKEKLKEIKKINQRLTNTSFKNNIMRECCDLFYDENLLFIIRTKFFFNCNKQIPRDLNQIIFKYLDIYD